MNIFKTITTAGYGLYSKFMKFYHDQRIPDGTPEEHLEMADKMNRAAEQLRGLAAIAQPANDEVAQQCLERAELHQTWAQKYRDRAQTRRQQ